MADVQLVITRTFDASKEDVYRAWTDKDSVAQWYGPEGFINEIHEWDLREGGCYRLTMKAPDGSTHPLKGEFKTLDDPNKLVLTWQWENAEGVEGMGDKTIVTVELKETDGKTEMTMTHSGFPTEAIKEHHDMGWISSFGKLEKLLG